MLHPTRSSRPLQPNAEPGQGSRRNGRATTVFWILFCINFLNYLDRYVMTGAANVMAKELGFDLSGVGYITSAFLVIYTLGTIPFGIWADRSRRKDVVAFSVAVWSIVTACTALAVNFWTLFISRMLLGVGEAGYFPAGTALLSDYVDRSRRSRVMSWWNTAQLFGILFGYGIGGSLAGLYVGSWRLAFLFTGIPGLVLAFLAWRIREPRRNQADEEARTETDHALTDADAFASAAKAPETTTQPPPQSGLWSQLRTTASQFRLLLSIKTLVILIAMQVCAYFVLGVNTAFLPIFLQQRDTYALSSSVAGLYSGGVIVVAGIAGTVLGGYMSDMLSRWHQGSRVLVCGIGFLVGAPSFALAITSHNFGLFTLFFCLTTLLLTIYTGPSTAASQDVVPSVLRASAMAVVLLIAHLLGDAFAPSIVGLLATSFDPTHGTHFLHAEAGQDLALALLVTCVPALILAGLFGIFGARWMGDDVAAAERINVQNAHTRTGDIGN